MDEKVLDGTQKALPNSTAILILGICSIVLCFCYFCIGFLGITCGIIALVLAKGDNKLYIENPEKYTEASFSNLKAGKVCAIIGLCMSSLYLLFIGIYFILAFAGVFGSEVFEKFFAI